jgi:RNA polymerase sigma-70 factor (ECF subfamily)
VELEFGIQVAEKGDGLTDEAFNRVVQDVGPRLFAYIRIRERSSADAEDVMGETLERAYRSWRSGRRPQGEATAWLCTIARNLLIDRSRRRRIRQLVRPSVPAASNGELDGSAERLWFSGLSAVLTRRQYEAVLLHYLLDLDDRAIAAQLGISASGARALLSRALSVLRQHPDILQ